MKQIFLCAFAIVQLATISAQESHFIYASSTGNINKSYYRLGENLLTIAKHGTLGNEPYVLLSLHNNETTSIEVAKEFVNKNGGLFIELQNQQQRMVCVSLYNKTIAMDPNRIFTPEGRMAGLRKASNKDERFARQIAEFSQFILNEIPANKVIIAMHNNTDGEYSIRSYVKHPAIKRDAKEVHVNPEMDEDDFFYTTSKPIFEQLKARNYNVVLQSSKAYDDGSLSIYCGRMNLPYVNIETEMGHSEEQKKMLATLVGIWE